MTSKYGILANPAKHSLSPVMHNAAFRALKMNAQYGIFEVSEDQLKTFMDSVKHEPIDGLSVSLPYKEKIMQYLDVIDGDAERIGAVNTVVNKGGNLYGYNTDFRGAVKSLKEIYPDLNEKIAVIVGAGGSARACAYGFLKEGSHVWIKNRTKEKADLIAIEFAEMFEAEIHSDTWDSKGTGDILINTTSIWLNSEGRDSPELPYFCKSAFLEEFDVIMDLTYKPLITPLLEAAKDLGKTAITGDKMLLYQGAMQFKLWTGREAPLSVMREALKNVLA